MNVIIHYIYIYFFFLQNIFIGKSYVYSKQGWFGHKINNVTFNKTVQQIFKHYAATSGFLF